MYLVGLTGGIASGKSHVAGIFEQFGARVIDADAVARQVVLPGTSGLVQVVGAFGYEILLPTGELDRKRLGEIVFEDPAKRLELEAILHPLIKERTSKLIAEQTAEIVIYAVPLLVEAKVDYPFDAVVTVEAGADNQIERLVASRSLTESEARQRIGAQASSQERMKRADFVIDSSGTKDQTRQQVDAIWKQLVQLAREKVQSATN
jgi:dephospho-CoA kinase